MHEPRPITVAIERTADSDLDRYAQAWVRHGVDLASLFPGGFASQSRVERRTGIEGWFDAPQGSWSTATGSGSRRW